MILIMRYLLLLALSLLLACDAIDVGEDLDLGDAGAPPSDASVSDDGAVDPPGDDDDDDGVGDPDPIDPDPEDEKPWRYYVEGDECDLVSQNCPFVNQTCVRERVDAGFGRAICVSEWGHRHEGHTAGWCTHSKESQATDCEKGMVCLGYLCHVPCDPDGDPCRTGAGGSPQSCVFTDQYPQPYCSAYE